MATEQSLPQAPTVGERAETAAQLRVALARASRRLRQQAGDELSPSRASVLGTVACHGPLTTSELAERELISRPTISRLVAKLESQGLVEFHPDPDDGRSFSVAVTPEGAALFRDQRRRKDTYLTRLLAEVDGEELELLGRATELLLRLLAENA